MSARGKRVGYARHRHDRHVTVPNWLTPLLLLLALPLSMAAAGSGVMPGDVAIARAVQSGLPGIADPLVTVVNLLGTTPVMLTIALGVAAFLSYRGHHRGALLVAAALLAQLANVALKLSIESPRPTGSFVAVSEQASGFGFPSGHTMGTTAISLVILYVVTTLVRDRVRLRMAQAGLLVLPVLMGISRIETGAHWPSDVLGGWLWGTLAAIAIVTLVPRVMALRVPSLRPNRTVEATMIVSDPSGD